MSQPIAMKSVVIGGREYQVKVFAPHGTESRKPKGLRCPDCGGPIDAWKLKRGYHCDNCTRRADPRGWANEVCGLYDEPRY